MTSRTSLPACTPHSAEFVGELEQTRTAIRSVPSANPRLTAVVGPEPGSDPFTPALPAE
jgi:hypothetical protein